VATQARPAYYSADRWQSLYFLEGWLEYQDMPTTVLRRAHAEARILEKSRPIICEGELIVGQLDFLPYTPEEQERFDKLYEMFKMAPKIKGRTDHMSLDYEKLLKVGARGLIGEIEARKGELAFGEPAEMAANLEKEEFYDGCLVELRALVGYAKRYAERARAMAAEAAAEASAGEAGTAGDAAEAGAGAKAAAARAAAAARSKELLEIAGVLDRVPEHPARSFREALQSIHFYTFNLFGLYALGRPDQYLLPYYEADIGAGRLTREEAQELIDNFCMLYATYIFSRASVSAMVGGTSRGGEPVENELTYMFLNSISHTRMADPSIGLCLTGQTSERLLKCSLRLLADGHSHPALFNDRAISDSLAGYGFDRGDAREYIHTTCVEITACCKSNMWTTVPWVCIGSIFVKTLYENAEPEYACLDDIFARFGENLREHLRGACKRYAVIQMERARNGAEPLRASCLIGDCLRRGKSIGQGGAVYNQFMASFVGAANVVDSLAAIEKLVFREKRLTLGELKEVLDRNYEGEGDEALRQHIVRKVPHYGNDDAFTDGLMARLMKILAESCGGIFNYRGAGVIPGAFAYNIHVDMGAYLQATPDGRRKGEPLSDSAGAAQGRDTAGPTAAILSATSWDQSPFLGGIALNLKFGKEMMAGDSIGNIAALVKTLMQRGGLEAQINAVDAKALEDAMEHPERHRDLLVRVGGYSDYFVKLSEQLQREIISRTAHTA
jgi:formate C-acetyltransferase